MTTYNQRTTVCRESHSGKQLAKPGRTTELLSKGKNSIPFVQVTVHTKIHSKYGKKASAKAKIIGKTAALNNQKMMDDFVNGWLLSSVSKECIRQTNLLDGNNNNREDNNSNNIQNITLIPFQYKPNDNNPQDKTGLEIKGFRLDIRRSSFSEISTGSGNNNNGGSAAGSSILDNVNALRNLASSLRLPNISATVAARNRRNEVMTNVTMNNSESHGMIDTMMPLSDVTERFAHARKRMSTFEPLQTPTQSNDVFRVVEITMRIDIGCFLVHSKVYREKDRCFCNSMDFIDMETGKPIGDLSYRMFAYRNLEMDNPHQQQRISPRTMTAMRNVHGCFMGREEVDPGVWYKHSCSIYDTDTSYIGICSGNTFVGTTMSSAMGQLASQQRRPEYSRKRVRNHEWPERFNDEREILEYVVPLFVTALTSSQKGSMYSHFDITVITTTSLPTAHSKGIIK